MAQVREFPLRSHQIPSSRLKIDWKILIILCALALSALSLPSASAQTQQPFLIAVQTASSQHGTVTFVRDDTTGVLTFVPNSAVNFTNPCSPFIAEPKYRFLFGACGNGLSMYTLDGSTGLIAEVPASPFAASIGNLAQLLVAESTGQYVYLLKTSSTASTSANSLVLDSFQIDAQTHVLVLASSQTLPLVGDPAGAVADPNGHGFVVFLNQDQGGAQPVPVLYSVTFDPSSGLPVLPASGTSLPGTNARAVAIGPKGKFMSVIFGPNAEFLTVYPLSTSNFQQLGSYSEYRCRYVFCGPRHVLRPHRHSDLHSVSEYESCFAGFHQFPDSGFGDAGRSAFFSDLFRACQQYWQWRFESLRSFCLR